jgi:transposase
MSEEYITTNELSKLYGVSIRTINNRLARFRKENPDKYKAVPAHTKVIRFLYRKDAITKEMITVRQYHKKTDADLIQEFNDRQEDMPDVTVEDEETGVVYNLFSLKALLHLLSNPSQLEKFMALNLALWIGIAIFTWSLFL